ncbi:MAG: CotH kinase family protein, partial [Kiritimatiellaeota bacterium]|nr:CotH kinase family protein [Kiritimatiellota bacterium]
MLAERYALPFQSTPPELHANFSISADGETIVLTRSDGTTEDSLVVPPLPTGASYGLSPDGVGGGPAYFADPTPGAPNTSTAYGPPVALPDFSHTRGIYDVPFSLSLAHGDPGASLHYTLDGSAPSATNGILYGAPLAVAGTTVVRAVAVKPGALPTRDVATHTYLFLDSVIAQTNHPAGYPPTWNGFAQVSYGISPWVAAQPGHSDALRESLLAIPVLSVTAPVGDLFGTGGVYANPTVDGLERAVSAEWITNGVGQVQIDAGLRVQGGASRQFGNSPKKSLRLLFKSAYGPGRLREPVLADGGGADFNTLVLRAEYNTSWVHSDGTQRAYSIYMRDQWVRDMQTAMSGSGSRGTHVHLFLNGLYWGLYNVAERPDAAFAASVFGDEREDYDTMVPQGIRDGNNIAWNAMHDIAKAGLASQSQYEAIAQYLDIGHLADYMLLNFYAGNDDWPHHNWSCVRRRETGAGYRVYVWDAERTLEGVNVNRTGATHTSGPAYLHTALCANPEYRLRFADRVHRHLFNDGPLTPPAAAASFTALARTVESAIYGEAARWGAYRNEITSGGSVKRYGTNDWTAELDRLLTVYFPQRTAIVLTQLRNANLYPPVDAPEFSQHGGVVPDGTTVAITAAQGAIHVTFDGTDPREPFTGAVAPAAAEYAAPFAVTAKTTVKARALHNGQWSALTEALFPPPPPDYAALRVAELMYAPPGGDDYAWIDLVNTSAQPLDLSGVSFVPTGAEDPAIEWAAPEGLTVPGGGHIVLVRNPATFATRNTVPPGTPVLQYKKNLARSGEPVTLADPSGEPFFSFTYSRYWYPETFDSGLSLVAVDFLAPEPLWSTAANWRPSTVPDGTPAASESPRVKSLNVQGGVLTFTADGIEWGHSILWSVDLADWHALPPGSVTITGGTVTIPLPPEATATNRCFFKIINP